mmetsp:Transcript_18127/g.36613  ORF Transcript_18127/g.36613 Transcript_18127/m.36613 type:complete len:229 (+) Transcript_18127:390-1076(+)
MLISTVCVAAQAGGIEAYVSLVSCISSECSPISQEKSICCMFIIRLVSDSRSHGIVIPVLRMSECTVMVSGFSMLTSHAMHVTTVSSSGVRSPLVDVYTVTSMSVAADPVKERDTVKPASPSIYLSMKSSIWSLPSGFNSPSTLKTTTSCFWRSGMRSVMATLPETTRAHEASTSWKSFMSASTISQSNVVVIPNSSVSLSSSTSHSPSTSAKMSPSSLVLSFTSSLP